MQSVDELHAQFLKADQRKDAIKAVEAVFVQRMQQYQDGIEILEVRESKLGNLDSWEF